MIHKTFLSTLAMTTLVFAGAVQASTAQIQVDFTNQAPAGGTIQTPVWVGFHDGSFNTFSSGQSATAGLEALAEDGNTGILSAEFSSQTMGGVDGTVGAAPIGPQGMVSHTFDVSTQGQNQYFSYASMVLASSDYFIGNSDPLAVDLSDLLSGLVSSIQFDVFRVYDAGTEVNDFQSAPAPANAAFGIVGGQTMPNEGADENGTVSFVAAAGEGGTAALVAYQSFLHADNIGQEAFNRLNFSRYDKLASFTLTNVSEVPVPAALWLFGPALMGVLGLRRKAQRT